MTKFKCRKIIVETSQFDTNSFWVQGSEYFGVEIVIKYPADLDYLSDDELDELADNENNNEVFYLNQQEQSNEVDAQ